MFLRTSIFNSIADCTFCIKDTVSMFKRSIPISGWKKSFEYRWYCWKKQLNKLLCNLNFQFDIVIHLIEMEPLESTRRALIWLCVISDGASSIWKKMANIAFTILLLLFFVTGFITSTIFFLKFVSIDLEEALYALFQIAGTTDGLYITTVGYLIRRKINRAMESLRKIYRACMEISITTKNWIVKLIAFL